MKGPGSIKVSGKIEFVQPPAENEAGFSPRGGMKGLGLYNEDSDHGASPSLILLSLPPLPASSLPLRRRLRG